MGVLLEKHGSLIEKHFAKYPDRLSALMPILYIAQEEYGHLSDEAIKEVAEIVGTDETHIRGVVGFYTMYYDKPKGVYLIQICTDLPCALAGAEKVAEAVLKHLDITPGETTSDGLFTVEKVVCLGNCHHAGVLMVNFRQYADLTPESAVTLIEELRRGYQASRPYSSD